MAANAEKDISQQIKNATSELLVQPDWAANLTICDKLNGHPELCAHAVSKLSKRLTNKNTEVAILSLTLLDQLVKNCPSIHGHIASADFMKVLLKLLEQPKSGFLRRAPESNMQRLELRERTLVLIQSWGRAFEKSRQFPVFYQTYDNLRRQGVIFPQPHKDELAPVFTPPVTVPKEPPPAKRQSGGLKDTNCRAIAEQCQLLHDMLTHSDPKDNLKNNDLIVDLMSRVTAAQQSTMQRLNNPPDDPALLDELLLTNDMCLDVLKYYHGLLDGTMERVRAGSQDDEKVPSSSSSTRGSTSTAPSAPPAASSTKAASTPSVKNTPPEVIDFFGLENKQLDKKQASPPTSSILAAAPAASTPVMLPGPPGGTAVPVIAPPPTKTKRKKHGSQGNAAASEVSPVASSGPKSAQGITNQLDLLDLNDILSGPPASAAAPAAGSSPNTTNPFDDLFDASHEPTPGAAPAQPKAVARQASEPEEEDDEFMALATRDVPKKAPVSTKAKAVPVDPFGF